MKKKYLIIAATALFIFSALWKLASSPIYLWDEALYANNAMEMLMTKDYWTMRIDGQPSLYNTKPPLAVWIQALSMRLFDISELSVRLPSILSLVGIFFIMYRFCRKHLDAEIALSSFITLLLSLGFMRSHITRSGDLDAVLAFFMTLYIFSFFDLLLSKNPTKNIQYIWLGLGITGSFFTKSTACLLPLPALLITTFYTKNGLVQLRDVRLLFVLCVPLLMAIAYYIHMETIVIGYWQKVYTSEFQRSYKDLMPWFEHKWYYYFESVWMKFFPFVLLFPTVFITKEPIPKLFIIFLLLFLVFISIPPTRLDWYLAPIYPIMALSIAILFREIWKKTTLFDNKLATYGFILLTFAALLYPINELYKINSYTGVLVDLEEPGYYMRELKKRKPNFKKYIVTMSSRHEEHYQQAIFYKQLFNHFHDYNIRFTPTIENISQTDTVLACQPLKIDSLKVKGFTEVIDASERYQNCKLLIKPK